MGRKQTRKLPATGSGTRNDAYTRPAIQSPMLRDAMSRTGRSDMLEVCE